MDAKFRDRLGSVIMLAFIAILWGSRSHTTPFGWILPDAVMILMTALVVVTLIRSFTRGPAMEVESKQKEDEKEEKHWLDMAVVMGILLLWVLLFRYAGIRPGGRGGIRVHRLVHQREAQGLEDDGQGRGRGDGRYVRAHGNFRLSPAGAPARGRDFRLTDSGGPLDTGEQERQGS